MKKSLLFILFFACIQFLIAQNVGIGVLNPSNKLQVHGNFVATEPVATAFNSPTPSQQITMVNNSSYYFYSSDSVGTIYDPGGLAGNYIANLNSSANFYSGDNRIGFEIDISSIQLGAFDSLIIQHAISSNPIRFLAIGNNHNTPIKLNINYPTAHIIFKSNGDASVGSGFVLNFKKIFRVSSPAPSKYVGRSFLFDVSKGSLRSGLIGTDPIGLNSVAMGEGTNATGYASFAMGEDSKAAGNYSTALGNSSYAAGSYSTALGLATRANASRSLVVGYMNDPIVDVDFGGPTAPLFIIGNGAPFSASNAMVVQANGNMGIGTNTPGSDIHIKHSAGGGLMLENANNNNKWRLYSASGDNNLTFYNNANAEIADIDDVTGVFSALSDSRFKKNIEQMPPVLSSVMKLQPKDFHFNWQKETASKEVGMLAQETFALFPALVSYDKEKDLYKMNYAGFSTVAIKAIQEQQVIINEQQQVIDKLVERIEKLENHLK